MFDRSIRCLHPMLPFSREQFVGVFADYNSLLGPLHSAAPLLGLVLVVLLAYPSAGRERLIGIGLAALWIWTGIVYHGLYFARINPAAWLFAALFVLQGGLLLHAAIAREELRFKAGHGAARVAGWALIAYAVVLYPIVGLLSGQPFAELPAFGLTPCPLTLTTLGCLLLTGPSTPRMLWPIPLVWSLVGGSAAIVLAMPQDWPLLAAGVGAAALLWLGHEQAGAPALAAPPQPADGIRSGSSRDDPDPMRTARH